jgi:uncharacterized membrane protein
MMELPDDGFDVPPDAPPPAAGPVQPLDYQRRKASDREPTQTPFTQSLLALVSFGFVLMTALRLPAVGGVLLAALLVFGVFARARWGWRGFLAAILLYTCTIGLLVGTCFSLFSTPHH